MEVVMIYNKYSAIGNPGIGNYNGYQNNYQNMNFDNQPARFMTNNQFSGPNYQNQQMMTIPGRFVNVIEEVVPNEVPMDGTIGLFPTKDLTKIYAKAWNNDGTISTVEYIAKQKEDPQKEPDKFQELAVKLESSINCRFDSLEKLLTSKQKTIKKEEPKEEN